MLTKNLKTHLVVLSDGREIPITFNQHNWLVLMIQDWKSSDLITIRDEDTQNVLFEWRSQSIKEFKEIKRSDIGWLMFICEFWIRHNLHESCNCPMKYRIFPAMFSAKKFELYWQKYPGDLINIERNNILALSSKF